MSASRPPIGRSIALPPAEWLALGPASRLIGVDPDTLRRWADDGRITAYATPGGHRRFARRDLERLVAAGRTSPNGTISALGATTARVSAAYRRGYLRTRPAPHGAAPLAIPPIEREAFREDGRQLVATLLEHLDTDDPGARARTEREAAAVSRELGRRLAAGGVPLVEAVTMFVAARRPFLGEIAALARRRSLPADRLADLYDRATAVLDRLMLGFVDAHATAARPVKVPAAKREGARRRVDDRATAIPLSVPES